MNRILVTAVAAALFAGPALTQGRAMTQDQLKELTADGVTLKLGGEGHGYSGELMLAADGTGKGAAKTDDGTVLSLTGTYEVRDGQFCRSWMEFSDGAEVCETWMLTSDNSVDVMVDGNKIGVNSW
ncbi:MAG: hypothetical protein QNJ20_16215 [Paracoccaceae bacterium]|nr:hypothetical protein [Paracoccaceae bacterium]